MRPPREGAFASPLFDPLHQWLEKLPPGRSADPDELNALHPCMPLSGGGVPICFVSAAQPQARTYAGQYEVRTFLRGEIPVREASLHDQFNALAWLAFPCSKGAINQRHFVELECEREQRGSTQGEAFSPCGRRSATRDALTLFDESGVIVASPRADLLDLIRNHQWKALFWERRSEVRREMRFFVIGHALHEKALHAYKGMTARALLLVVPPSFLELPPAAQRETIDRQAAGQVKMPGLLESTRELPPLPLAGIPGWSDNDDPAFYDDAAVFR